MLSTKNETSSLCARLAEVRHRKQLHAAAFTSGFGHGFAGFLDVCFRQRLCFAMLFRLFRHAPSKLIGNPILPRVAFTGRWHQLLAGEGLYTSEIRRMPMRPQDRILCRICRKIRPFKHLVPSTPLHPRSLHLVQLAVASALSPLSR